MRFRRLLSLLVGVWLAGLGGTAYLASHNFQVARFVMESSPAEGRKSIEKLGEVSTERLLRHHAGEINRSMFEKWGAVEMGLLGTILLLLVFRHDSKAAIVIAVLSLVAAGWSHLLLAPQLTAIGRLRDFQPDPSQGEWVKQFASVHRQYALVGFLRIVAGGALAFLLLRRGGESVLRRRKTDKVDVVNKTDYSHINR